MKAATALIAGILLTASLAPLNIWPTAIGGLLLLLWVLHQASPKTAFFRGWLFGIGLFGSGASWVFVSIKQFGNASMPLALFLTALWCAGLGLLPAITCAFMRWLNSNNARRDVLLFPAIWVLGEWTRTWLLTGFPWLFIGYGQVQGPLQGLAPISGVLGISFTLALTAAVLWCLALGSRTGDLRKNLSFPQSIPIGLLLAIWVVALLVDPLHWTQATNKQLSAGLVQANIDQNEKWQRSKIAGHIALQREMSEQLWGKDLVLWPEAAIPVLYQHADGILDQLQRRASNSGSRFITGIPYRDPETGAVYNSIASLGEDRQLYFKRNLVPFGEFMPLESVLRGLIDFFDLPMSSFSAGPAQQQYLQIGELQAAALICYEAVYLDTVSQANTPPPDLLLTISNDTWFGNSFGPLQHLQMAQMRALEWGRGMVRGTNNGVSALIAADGSILARTEQFKQQVLSGDIPIRSGMTPYARFGERPTVFLSLLILALCGFLPAFRSSKPQ
ncbi:MAG: apolipoprotein N-acyltransferase [Pseudomonadales bacterium]